MVSLNESDKLFDIVFNKHKNALSLAILKEYIGGSLDVTNSKGLNPLSPDKQKVKLMTDKVGDLIKGITDDMKKDVKITVRDGLLKGKSYQDIAKDLDQVFKGSNNTKFKYEDRLKAIARTESKNAFESGAYDTAKKLGFNAKYLDVMEDERTSDICGKMHSKYGSKDQAIGVNDLFTVVANGKTISSPVSPFHVNCRTRVIYEFREDL